MSRQSTRVLRQFIRESLGRKRSQSAGIVILRRFGDEFKVLCLKELEGSRYDLTKGRMDCGENTLDTAIRETYEESGIDDVKFTWGLDPVQCSETTMYVGETSQDPTITHNPQTGKYEHLGASWCSFEEAKSLVKKWLVPAITYAENICSDR